MPEETERAQRPQPRLNMSTPPHAAHRLRQTHLFELVCIERYTAKPETTKKTKSTARHQVGAPLQQALEQA